MVAVMRMDPDELKELCEEYEVSNDVAKEDVAKIIGQWQKEGVIE